MNKFWCELKKFKFIILRIYNYATASSESTVYIIGGIGETYKYHESRDCRGGGRICDYELYNGEITTIAGFKNNKWTQIGNLKQKRRNASALLLNAELIIAGGQVDKSHIKRKCDSYSSRRGRCYEYENPIPE